MPISPYHEFVCLRRPAESAYGLPSPFGLNLGLVATSVQPLSFWGARRFTLAAFEIVAIQRQRDKYTPAEAFGAPRTSQGGSSAR
jgi:hypothetical protein